MIPRIIPQLVKKRAGNGQLRNGRFSAVNGTLLAINYIYLFFISINTQFRGQQWTYTAIGMPDFSKPEKK